MPTEEVYVAPDCRRTEGVVRSTRPLALLGTLVEGLELRFEDGRIVDVQAAQGADVVRTQTQRDEGAARLGEVALVDGSSRVGQTGLVFYDTLFDENATCHIAYGKAITRTVPGSGSLSPEERVAARRQPLGGAHGLHDRRPGGERRRAHRVRRHGADHPRRRVGAG